jgi:hypothetical protein
VTTWVPTATVLREPLDRPRLLRIAIRAESVPADGPEVAHGVVARVEGGYFVAGPPATPFHTVALWAGSPQTAVALGCMPTDRAAAVEVWAVHETQTGASVEPTAGGTVQVERYGDMVTLTCRDSVSEDASLIVDLLWEDG